jgi:hypothetical protein
MRTAYFDCFCGAAGDMILAAMIDAGLPAEVLQGVIAQLGLPEVTLTASKVRRGGLAATHVTVAVGPAARKHHRHLSEIADMIARAELPCEVVDRATRVFRRLADAEAAVHGTTVEAVHFHEVGAADAIVDIVGACAGLHALGIERVACSPIPTGSGVVRCQHGLLPVPPPATAALLRGVPIAASDIATELCTPTGAAILTTFATAFGPPPAMTMEAIGYGAGAREFPQRANVLRLIVGDAQEARDAAEIDVVAVLETHVDDMTGQQVAHALEHALAAGALDAYATPIGMKKGRPGQLLTVLCRPEDADAVAALLFADTTTFGVRRRTCERHTLAREHVAVETPFGAIRVKLGRRGGRVLQAAPEYEDCAAAARTHGVALRAVQDAARMAWALKQDAPSVERSG